jgi:predicted signal transduction protein with EAL and GGDEF domain
MCQPFTIDDLALSIGASVGITMLPETGDGFDSVVSRADSAMYQAKAERRGTFHTYQTANRQQLR